MYVWFTSKHWHKAHKVQINHSRFKQLSSRGGTRKVSSNIFIYTVYMIVYITIYIYNFMIIKSILDDAMFVQCNITKTHYWSIVCLGKHMANPIEPLGHHWTALFVTPWRQSCYQPPSQTNFSFTQKIGQFRCQSLLADALHTPQKA